MTTTVAEIQDKVVHARPKRVAATAALGTLSVIGWVAGVISVSVLKAVTAVGWGIGLITRVGLNCWTALAYGFCKGAGIKSVKKADLQAPTGPPHAIPPNSSPGTFPGTFIQ
jgi:hypothetical protein